MTESLSLDQARKLILLSQRVPPAPPTGRATEATLSAIEHLGYIQIDTISVVQRAHHHTLWNRNPRYMPAQLDQLLSSRQIYEYWSHATAYLPFRDYRFSLPRKAAFANGKQRHWYRRDERLIQMVLKRIATEGPLLAKDFEHTGKKTGEWNAKPAKRALEYLFMQGDLMVPRRVNFHKVYDLTERVLPAGIDTTLPSPQEYARFLIAQYMRANGLGQAAEITYLLKDIKPLVSKTLKDMGSNGELQKVSVDGKPYFASPTSLELLSRPLARGKLKILSPFDNLVIQRKRIKTLFGFDYLIECYVPEKKRRYGYFSLPILWDGKLVARMDCKAERSEALLHIHHLALEPIELKTDTLFHAMGKELKAFLKFNGCDKIKLHRTTPAQAKREFQMLIKDLNE